MNGLSYGLLASLLKGQPQQSQQSGFTGFLNQMKYSDPMSTGQKFIRAFFPKESAQVDNQRSYEILKKLLPDMGQDQLQRFKQNEFTQEDADEILKKMYAKSPEEQPMLTAESPRFLGRSRARRG